MYRAAALASSLSFLSAVYAQQVGTNTAETHPPLTWQVCTAPGSCTTQSSSIVLDANWRWVHNVGGSTNCYDGNTWNTAYCPNTDGAACAKNCALEGADYSGTYGITTSGSALTLKFKTGSNVGSRVYLMAPGSTTMYQQFKMKAQEFTFDVDVSKLPCGLNGAVYFSQMDADGGMAKFANNKAGAKYGTGYCDSQCPHDVKFISGEANNVGWNPDSNSANSGKGKYGTCCNEMDLWEANSISTAYTPHPCTVDGPYRCGASGDDCGDADRSAGVCDKSGCDFNSYRNGVKDFYGPGFTGVDTTKPFTIVTQFLTTTGTASGALSEIRRLYVQNGVVISNTHVNVPGVSSAYDSVKADYCADVKAVQGDPNDWLAKGGMGPMDKALTSGMTLVLSIWDDYAVNMLWLDSDYPTDADPSAPGVARGTCPTTSGVPSQVEANGGSITVTYSNIKIGPIGSTYSGTTQSTSKGPSSSSAKPPSSSSKPASTSSVKPPSSSSKPASTTAKPTSSTKTSSAQGAGQTLWGQCGGQGWAGPTTCAQGTCKYSNPWYSQCLN